MRKLLPCTVGVTVKSWTKLGYGFQLLGRRATQAAEPSQEILVIVIVVCHAANIYKTQLVL